MANLLAHKHAAGTTGFSCRDRVGLGASLRRVRHRADLGLLSAGHSGEALGQSTGHWVVCGLSTPVGVLSRGDAAALDPRLGFAPPGLVLSLCASITASTIQCNWRSTSRSRALPSCSGKAERARPHYCAPSPACCPLMANLLAACCRSSVPSVICRKAM